MAFLLLLTGQAPKALPFIKTAQELDPGSELAQQLLEQAQRPARALQLRPEPANPPLNPPLNTQAAVPVKASAGPRVAPAKDEFELDYDALYDATEAEIQAFIRELASFSALGQTPAPDPKKLAQLQDRLARFSEKTQDFHGQLEILDDELDVNVLRRNLNALEGVLKRLSAQIQLFEQFIEIDQDIRKHTELTDAVIQESQTTQDAADIEVLEENLQVLLDHCDGIADRLEALEARKIDIASLQTPYDKYTERLEEFQDVLKEVIERLRIP